MPQMLSNLNYYCILNGIQEVISKRIILFQTPHVQVKQLFDLQFMRISTRRLVQYKLLCLNLYNLKIV